MPTDTPIADALQERLCANHGSDWPRKLIKVKMKIADLYWLVQLIEVGIAARKAQWKESNGGKLDAESACSIADFNRMVLELSQEVCPVKEG